jgi:hypothetical protein
MVLRGEFSTSKTSVLHNEAFTVNVNMRNIGALESFARGQLGVVLVDSNNTIVENIGTLNTAGLGIGNTWTVRAINCSVPSAVAKGRYKLRIVTRPTDGEWKLVELSEVRNGVPTSIDFTVQ